MALAGCGQRPEPKDAKIAGLEARVAHLEEAVATMYVIVTNVPPHLDFIQAEGLRQSQALESLVTKKHKQQSEISDQVMAALRDVMVEMTNGTPRQSARYTAPATAAARPVYAQTKEGVPLAVYNDIEARAVREWPGDYKMQAYTIKGQIEAYRKLHP